LRLGGARKPVIPWVIPVLLSHASVSCPLRQRTISTQSFFQGFCSDSLFSRAPPSGVE